MRELDPFEVRLAAEVHAFADRAVTGVDAMEVAERSIRQRRRGILSLAVMPLPVPAAVLVTLALLVGLLAWSVSIGAPRGPVPAVPVPSPTPTASGRPTPVPTTDGQGDEYVTGTEAATLVSEYTQTKVGDITQVRGVVVRVVETMNDPRVSGTGTFSFSSDLYTTGLGPAWGTLRIENADGAWEGPCRGAGRSWGDAIARACWLAGSGAYEGYSYYLQAEAPSPSQAGSVQGLIYAGAPPAGQGEG